MTHFHDTSDDFDDFDDLDDLDDNTVLAIKKPCENSNLSALVLHVTLHVLFENTILGILD